MDEYLTADEVANLLKVNKSTIYQWTHIDFIPFVKVGRLVRFKPDAVMKWIDATETGGRKNRKYDIRDLGV